MSISSSSPSSSDSLPALIRPSGDPNPLVPMDDMSSFDDSNPESWTQSTASTMDETDPFGFDLYDLPNDPPPPISYPMPPPKRPNVAR